MPAAVKFAGPAGPARVALASATPAGRVLQAVARATSPATTSATAPRIVQETQRVPIASASPSSAAARVIALAQQAARSAAPTLRPSGLVPPAPANRLRSPIFTAAAAALPAPSAPSIGPLGPVYAAPAAFQTGGYSGGGSSYAASYASDGTEDDGGVWDVPPTFAAAPTPMQTRSMLGVEAPTSVWWIVAGAGAAFVAYHLYRRDFAGRRA